MDSRLQEAFQSLKTKLSTAPILAFHHPGVPFIVDANASNVGISAVLSQEIDGTERVIAYGSCPILAFPHPGVPFIVDADASNVGISAVLSQEIDGIERVTAYGSCALSKLERQYCITQRELLAIVTFLKQFRPYLLGRHFQVRTRRSTGPLVGAATGI